MDAKPKSEWDKEISPRSFGLAAGIIVLAVVICVCWTSWLNHQYRIEQLRVQPNQVSDQGAEFTGTD